MTLASVLSRTVEVVVAHRRDRADQALAVQHGLIRLDAVGASGVDGDRVVVGSPGGDHAGRDDPVPAPAGQRQQLAELRRGRPVQPLLAELGPQPDNLPLQRRDLGLRPAPAGQPIGEGPERPGDDAGRVLHRAEHGAAHAAQPAHRGGGATPVVNRDQCQRGGQQHPENEAGPPGVMHQVSSPASRPSPGSGRHRSLLRPARSGAVTVWIREPAPDAGYRSPRRTSRCPAPRTRAGCRRRGPACRFPPGSGQTGRAAARPRRSARCPGP